MTAAFDARAAREAEKRRALWRPTEPAPWPPKAPRRPQTKQQAAVEYLRACPVGSLAMLVTRHTSALHSVRALVARRGGSVPADYVQDVSAQVCAAIGASPHRITGGARIAGDAIDPAGHVASRLALVLGKPVRATAL
jgi:hypothetical protein